METKVTKKHNTSENSIQSFIDYNRQGSLVKDTVKVFDALKQHQPVTSRQLVRFTGLERSNLTRLLFNMVNTADPLIKIVFDRPCPLTRRTVHWYAMIEFEAGEEA